MVKKQKRVFIVSDKQFPHGDAGGNRIEYMAKCFLYEGIQPIVLSLGKNSEKEFDTSKNLYSCDGVFYNNAVVKKSFISWYLKSGYRIATLLKAFALNENDRVVVYSTNPIFIFFIKRELRNAGGIYYDVVEWDDENSFKFKRFDPHYWLFRWCFYGIFPTGSGVISISKRIESFFRSKGKRTVLFPICLDYVSLGRDYNYRYFENSKLKLIYPGNPEHKDDIATVLSVISDIIKDMGPCIEMHFTSVSKERIKGLLERERNILEELKESVVFHPWLEYEDLIQLYYSMDALIMFRFDNQVSQSNFPSKVPELLACGVFIIANEVGDFFDYLTDRIDSIKICGNTQEACKNAILQALSLSTEDKKHMSDNAIKCAANKFNYKNYSKTITSFILHE